MSVHGFTDDKFFVDDPVTLISRLDVSNPLYLHPNDFAALTVVSVKLKEIENDQVWSCVMLLALEGKNKIGFIDGSCKRSNTDEFLMGLDNTYMQIRSSILFRETLPEVKSAYATISSEESHRVASGSIIGSPQRNHAFAFASNVPNKGNFQRNQTSNNTPRPNNVNNNRQNGGSRLVIPEYCVTLIFVKLAKDNKIVVAFDESRCYFLNQDLNLKNVLAIGANVSILDFFPLSAITFFNRLALISSVPDDRYAISNGSGYAGLKVGSIRCIQGIGYGVLEFLGVGTMFDIFHNIHILYFQYGVLVLWIRRIDLLSFVVFEFDIEIKDKTGIENVTADHLSRIENDKTNDNSDVDDNFPGDTLMEITTKDEPWFADFANYFVGDVFHKGMTYQQNKKLTSETTFGKTLTFSMYVQTTSTPRGGRTGRRTGRGGGRTGEPTSRVGGQTGDRDGQRDLLPTIIAQVGNHASNIQGDVRSVNMGNSRNGCSYKEFMACNPKDYDGKVGAIVYTRWIEKMESVQDISGCGANQKVKYTAGSFIGKELTWWNTHVQTRG
ncbi:ribonuclease H-like domain-containing protein [Tanacetum coccineum]|uniref:Ribonuclease H-like domain-containing protein n=1 Tax=Tanacetum coccineum TaxID=301880 RepID=A0ABQ4ZC35_9ASTR